MLNLTEHRKTADRITSLLPWACFAAPGVVLNKDGSLQQTIRYRGLDLEAVSKEHLLNTITRFNNLIKRLSSGWIIYIEARRETSNEYAQKQCFPDPISWLIDVERKDLFECDLGSYESKYYITFQYTPPSDADNKTVYRLHQHISNKKNTTAENHVRAFTAKVTAMYDILLDFMSEAEMLDDQATLSYLHQCISDKKHLMRSSEIPLCLDTVIVDKPLQAGLSPMLGNMHLAVISIQGLPPNSEPGLLDQINRLPIEYRWVTRYILLDKNNANAEINKFKTKWLSKCKSMKTLVPETLSKPEDVKVDSSAMTKVQDADAALQELNDNSVSFGYYTATITLWDQDQEFLKLKARKIEQVINSLGFTTINESVNCVEAWLSSLPGQSYTNVRMTLLHTLNLTHLIPFSSLWAGQEKDSLLNAPVLFYAKTYGNTPFRLSAHIGDVGHTLIVGPTSSGKSVLLNFMALQFLRYKNAQIFIFDKGYNFFKSTHGVNGNYYDLGADNSNFQLQPLAKIDELKEKQWAHDWILDLIENQNIEISPEIEDQIWQAIDQLAKKEIRHRTLSCLSSLIQNVTLRHALNEYLINGRYGNLLDADSEKLNFKNWQCFETKHLMDTPHVIASVLNYILHRIETQLTGSPTLIIINDARRFLDNPLFANRIKIWLRALRKLNASVVFATKSADDLINLKISSSLLESCPSRIFLPNKNATEAGISTSYKALGLSEEQVNIIASAAPKKEYYYSSILGNSLFKLNLDELTLFFCANCTKSEREKISSLYKKHSHMEFLQKIMKKNGLEWAIEKICKRKIT